MITLSKKALLWDLGNVLTTFEDRYQVLVKIITDRSGNPDALNRLFQASYEGTNFHERVYEDLDIGRLSFPQLHQKICRHAGISIGFDEFCRLYYRHLRPITAVVELYRQLQERYRMVVVSNGDFAARLLVQAMEVQRGLRFDQVFISYEHGCKKPELFEKVLEYLARHDIRPEDTVFIDDIYSAKSYGIPSVRFDGSKQSVEDLITDLQSHGVVIP